LNARTTAFVIFALAVAAGCVRLGFWQLDRLHTRRARNAEVTARLAMPPQAVAQLLASKDSLSFRRATATGTYDFANEVVLALRTHEGSPGVNLVTPLRIPGLDTAILVNRGWVYSPDGLHIDPAKWRESTEASVAGYLVPMVSDVRGIVSASRETRAVRQLDHDSLARNLPYPIATYALVALEPAGEIDRSPVRLTVPPLDEGPHRGYAIQWFAFAVIAVVGAGFVVFKPERRAVDRS
jgi:surfeit locus 1 family protein